MKHTPLLDYLLPRECHLCGSVLSGEDKYVCTPCLARLPRTAYHRMAGNPMERRFMGIVPYVRCSALLFYMPETEISAIVQDMKYRHFRGLCRMMGELMAKELLTTGFFNDVDYLMPVPMYFMKRIRRGYNQVEELCRGISHITGLPVDTSLRAIKPHRTQTRLSHEERLKNTAGIFRLYNAEKFAERHILLIDDVCTTGGTLISASRAILDGCEAARISILTLSATF